MNLRWDVQALHDLRDIHSYIATKSSKATADRLRRHFQTRANLLLTRPFLGVVSSSRGLRILQPTRYPYRIYYMVQGDEIVILHIRHTARQAPDDLGA